MLGCDGDHLAKSSASHPDFMAVDVEVQPPHEAVLRAQLARRHGLLNPSGWQDLLAVPDASSEIEFAELDHVRWAQSEQAARGVQAGGVGTPVEAGEHVVSGLAWQDAFLLS